MKHHVAALSFVLLGAASPALAQSPTGATSPEVLAAETESMHSVVRPETLRALGPLAASHAADAGYARYLRAVAGTDLHTLALVTHDAALDARVADAMGSTSEQLDAALQRELSAVASGVYRSTCEDELALLRAARAFERGEPIARGASGRTGALVLLAVADALGDPERLAAMGTDDESGLADIDVGVQWSVAAMHAGLAGYERSTRAARDGDSWLVALAPTLERADARIRAAILTPRAIVPRALEGLIDVGEGAQDTRPDIVLALERDRIGIVCTPRVRVPSATTVELIAPSERCPAVGTVRDVGLPALLPAVPRAIDSLVAALSELGVREGTTIALAPTRDASAQVVACVRRSLAQAHVTATTLALRDRDGAFITTPFAWAPLEATSFAMVVHVRAGGYAITRGHEHTVQLARRHDASGFSFDRGALASTIGAMSSEVALDAMGSVPAMELFQAARIVAASGARVVLRE